MTWLIVSALALLAFVALAFWLNVPRSGWTALGAALLFGLAGYAMQASPSLPGSTKVAAEQISIDPAAMLASRMARNGQYANAAQVLLGALDDDPKNAQAWLALGNALVAHADGLLTPAALHAYENAQASAPQSAGPPYFLGLALAQSGRFAEARATWTGLLERSAPDAPWREMLAERLAGLDLLIEAQARAQAGR